MIGCLWPLPRASHEVRAAGLVQCAAFSAVTERAARGFRRKRLGDGVDEERFGQAGNAHKQNVPACKNRSGDLADHLILAHDDLADFGEQGFVLGTERIERRFVVGEIRHSQVA